MHIILPELPVVDETSQSIQLEKIKEESKELIEAIDKYTETESMHDFLALQSEALDTVQAIAGLLQNTDTNVLDASLECHTSKLHRKYGAKGRTVFMTGRPS